jgi:hypothetical protein
MNFNKKTAISLLVSGLLATSSMVYAENADSAKNISDTIMHLEKGAVEAGKSDFSASTLHLKAARISSEEISEHDAATKAGLEKINLGMREVKLGHPEQAVVEINKAIAIYKGL